MVEHLVANQKIGVRFSLPALQVLKAKRPERVILLIQKGGDKTVSMWITDKKTDRFALEIVFNSE